jgi:Protein of unknown function (DUF4240)
MFLRRHIILFPLAFALGATTSPLFSAPAVMDNQQFWSLIHHAKSVAGADLAARPVALHRELSALSPADIQAFQARYESMLLEANRWTLWGAAYLMNGGCSDDGFKYFRDWLISEGEVTFKTALADPDSLAAQEKREYFELESFGYAAMKAFAAKSAGELERSFQVELAVPQGKEWAESELPRLFPRLAAKYNAK